MPTWLAYLLGVLHWRSSEPLEPADPDVREAYDDGRVLVHAWTGYRFDQGDT